MSEWAEVRANASVRPTESKFSPGLGAFKSIGENKMAKLFRILALMAHLQFVSVSLLATANEATWPLDSLPVTLGGSFDANNKARVVDVTAFGAVGDGKFDCTQAFRAAIENATAIGGDGGGVTLVVPHGDKSKESVYLTRSLTIAAASNLTLRIENNARVLAICDIPAWPVLAPWVSFGGQRKYAPFLHVVNSTDVILEGGGVLDGNGSCFWSHINGHHTDLKFERPRLMVMDNCSRAMVTGITFTNSPYWCVVFQNSRDVHVKGITVLNPTGGTGACPQPNGGPCFGPNADGIDLVSVQR